MRQTQRESETDRERETDRHRERETERESETDRERARETERQRDRETERERERERQTDRQTERESETDRGETCLCPTLAASYFPYSRKPSAPPRGRHQFDSTVTGLCRPLAPVDRTYKPILAAVFTMFVIIERRKERMLR